MESIFATAFGRRIEIQKGQSDPLVEAAVGIMTMFQEDSIFSPFYFSTIFSIKEQTLKMPHLFVCLFVLLSQAIFHGLLPLFPSS